jgi:hypothetical protein
MIQYTESNDVPGAILLLDIEKAFDSVNHDFCLKSSSVLILVIHLLNGFVRFIKTERDM